MTPNQMKKRMSEISAFANKVAEMFNPEKIILFGSFANGVPKGDSDVDILIIMPFEGKGYRKSLEILDATDPHFPIDLLTRLPQDTERRYREGDPVICMALDHGKILYERNGNHSIARIPDHDR